MVRPAMALIARTGEWITCSGRGAPSERYPFGVPYMHEVARFTRDVEEGELFDARIFTDWQGAHGTCNTRDGIRPVCSKCSAPWYDPERNVYHVEAPGAIGRQRLRC